MNKLQVFEYLTRTSMMDLPEVTCKNPKELIRIYHIVEDLQYRINTEYDYVTVSVQNLNWSGSAAEMFNISYDTANDCLRVFIRESSYSHMNFTEVREVSNCLTEEGFFQESLVQNLVFTQDELKSVIDILEYIQLKARAKYKITEQIPRGI